ncbi:MAG TPA: polysaccharide deacetylase family protein [Chloroflexota bacterium]|jgi:peptidoglycan/xylan/chitin deacetylase (PgdA/CDA1 family)|nr:polysaccharide deacetylase family protein [Chloroflexota bacterium]
MSRPVQVSRRSFFGLLSLALALLPVGVCALSEVDPLADAYAQLGGRARLGPILGPAFRRPTDPSLYLATQGTVLELAPDGRVGPASVMSWFTVAGHDDWLEAVRGVPRPLPDPAADPGESAAARRAWLTQPEIAATYLAGGEAAALRDWGLPASRPERFGPFLTQRFERGALQLWLDDVPGAPPPGTVVPVLVGDLLAEAGLLPFPIGALARPSLPPGVAPGDVLTRAGDRPGSGAGMVAITYDMGSVDDGLPGVLEALQSRGLRATFFVTGDFVRRYEWALPRLLELGHELANHTVSHTDLTRLPSDRVLREVDALDAALAARGAPPSLWFRPPFGAYDRRVRSLVSSRGYPLVMWRLDLADWRRDVSVGDVVRIARRIQPGDVVVTHGGLAKTAAAMPRVLDELAARGLRQVTLSELYAPG